MPEPKQGRAKANGDPPPPAPPASALPPVVTPLPSSPAPPPVVSTPSAPPPTETLTLPYHRTIRGLSDRIVEAQRPIRVLDACKWNEEVETRFFEKGAKELPEITREFYGRNALPFDVEAKHREFYDIERDIRRELGMLNPAGQLMLRTCKEYRMVLSMLTLRGTPDFSSISQGLYGSTFDRFYPGDPTIGDLGRKMVQILARLKDDVALMKDEKSIDAADAVKHLTERMDAYFGKGVVRVKLSDGVVADAAAGADYIKIRQDAKFSRRDLDILEVHEGWVHIGTTLNGAIQPVATFLSKGTPSCTVTQEGLAIIQEIFTFNSTPDRIRKLTDRIEAIRVAEEGGDFLDTYKMLLERGNDERTAYQTAYRAFRGSLPKGAGPFTKDLSYSRGFILIYNFVRLAVRQGLVHRIPLLFLGKIRIGDLGTLHQLVEDGTIQPPKYLPPPYTDLRGVAAWMCYSNFLNTINLERAAEDYASLLAGTTGEL
jgi:uncharacterized protein (TIGR02421 family)